MSYLYMQKILWYYSTGNRWKIVVYLMFHGLSILGELGQPLALSFMITSLQFSSSYQTQNLYFWIGVYFLSFLVFQIFHRIARILERNTAFCAKKNFTLDMYDKIISKPTNWHSENHSGNIMNRVNIASEALLEFGESQMIFVSAIFKFIFPMIALVIISPLIGFLATTGGFLIVLNTKKMYEKIVPNFREMNKRYHNVSATLYDYIGNVTTIINLNLKSILGNDIGSKIDKIFPFMKEENKFTQIKCLISDIINFLVTILSILIYVYVSITSGRVINVGLILLIIQYLQEYMKVYQFYAGDYESVIHWRTDFESIDNILNQSGPFVDPTQMENWHEVIISVPFFSYKDIETIKGIEIKLRRGKKIALIGKSGSGKSTILKLISGILISDEATVSFGNNDIRKLNEISLNTVLVPQDSEIFENSILYNLTFGLETDRDELIEILKRLSIWDKINGLEDHLNHIIRENGSNFSGGERQRIALARGINFMKGRELILLDEATSSIDTILEKEIYSYLFEKFSKKTMICAIHNVNLAPMFDYIYLLENGRIVDHGDFNHLITNESFKSICNT